VAKHLSETRTETLILDLLNIQGWATGRPPQGSAVRQNEYKSFLELEEIFKGKSKRGKGDAYPDFLLISRITHRPQMVIEAKSDVGDLKEAIADAIHYSEACMGAGHSVIAVGVAGQEKTKIDIGVLKNVQGEWKRVVYAGNLISWIPTPQDVISLLSSPTLLDLAPVVPRPEVLANKADLINRILREAYVKDEYRAAYVGAMMLALWQSRGSLRKDPDFVLRDINSACEDAYTKGGKPELAKSLHNSERLRGLLPPGPSAATDCLGLSFRLSRWPALSGLPGPIAAKASQGGSTGKSSPLWAHCRQKDLSEAPLKARNRLQAQATRFRGSQSLSKLGDFAGSWPALRWQEERHGP